MRQLQDELRDVPFDNLPPAWNTFDLATFSAGKRLWDYQQDALRNTLKALWKYYEDSGDYAPGAPGVGEPAAANAGRKSRLLDWYARNGLAEGLTLPTANLRRDVRKLLAEHYPVDGDEIPYEHFINRISLWMATGSGKTLVIVKLLELLWRLIRRGELPPCDVLLLTVRDDLIAQLRAHVDEFNASGIDPYIRLRELRDFAEVKRSGASLLREHELTVFYYRSDNLSDEQKEKIVDFRNYDNEGRWFVLLDEAHKGDRTEGKRQHIYSILSRNGFLFNFSATFTDPRDIRTTAFDFNLAKFIKDGFGKHIAILDQQVRFKVTEDYTAEEKQRVVFKALLLLAYMREVYERLPEGDNGKKAGDRKVGYHRPLLMVLVNSVDTKDADLKLFFRQMAAIGSGKAPPAAFEQAKTELFEELKSNPPYLFERDVAFTLDLPVWNALTYDRLLQLVYNSEDCARGDTEALVRPSNRKELALQLKGCGQPFALIKIGDITGWLKGELAEYQVNEGFSDEGFFDRLNADDSVINILLGARAFFEGWDSNRPNVITFINIGVSTDARKFILQSTGRGVRIEPVPGQRRRLQALANAGAVTSDQRESLWPGRALESLFILGTNRAALQFVLETMKQQGDDEPTEEISLARNDARIAGHVLLIPTFRDARQSIMAQKELVRFPLQDAEQDLLARYGRHLDDDRLFFARHDARPDQIATLRQVLAEPADDHFSARDARKYGSFDVLLPRLFQYFGVVGKEWESVRPLGDDDINHFRHIRVALKHMAVVQAIERVQNYPAALKEQLALFNAQEISAPDFAQNVQSLQKNATYIGDGQLLDIQHLEEHYYNPVLVAGQERITFINHVIRYESEHRFLRELEQHLRSKDNAFKAFDWWLFSKIDETLDKVSIPYFDPGANGIRQFYPDFIFWLQKGTRCFIVFVDPKGTKQTAYQSKVDAFERFFCQDGQPRQLQYDGLTVEVHLRLVTQDAALTQGAYRWCWIDRPEQIVQGL